MMRKIAEWSVKCGRGALEQNILSVFEEYGLPPRGVSLQWGVNGNGADITL